ncbi:hypothetical protein [Rhodohalobacter mucosus]|uniref:Uncharacterized protein n=1 Tax=Rhodohalobacter mucosus TaxID=2079485 RepID=A0A316TYI3_9BACT|nr:hypothetical protein [Rhodohalobacter mucosus]PWN07834.1 hypothetical protein DDZ15_02145 [Rhodohalobacter mucosus]
MLTNVDGISKILIYILLFPLYFQQAFLEFSWAGGDTLVVMTLKRLFLLLPALAIILGCWVTIPAFLSVIFRQNRKEYVTSIFITWWDLGKSIFSFWGGILQFFFNLVIALLELFKVLILSIWFVIQSILFMPFRLFGGASKKVVESNIPWIAVVLTLFWVLIEATIFTYVTTPLVVDTLSNITGEQLSMAFVRIPLFAFLFFIVLGSYAVLSTFVDSFKEKNIYQIAGIFAIEVIVLLVEVVFLYREFVDALVPWFALYANDFSITMTGILAVSAFMWFGIRSLSWFLFASHGTPTIMAVIQGEGIKLAEKAKTPKKGKKTDDGFGADLSNELIESLKKDVDWVQEKGDLLLSSFILPPLQVIAAAINFCTLLVTGSHLFNTPIKKLDDIRDSSEMLKAAAEKRADLKPAAPAES